jgi:hypothetical protein
MIFFGTLGGLFMFGMAGLLIGPVIASLFITIWEIYGEAFKDMLPPVYTNRARAEVGNGALGTEGWDDGPEDQPTTPGDEARTTPETNVQDMDTTSAGTAETESAEPPFKNR